MRTVSPSWCSRDALIVARELLGKVISIKGCSGMIVETEAYKRDPASHGYKITPRSEIMLRTHGRWYVYVIYGMYHCLNITTNKGDVGAVLIRAIEPLKGVEIMKQRRNTDAVHNIGSGPGKLCTALGINKTHNDTCITSDLTLHHYKKIANVVTSTRIGISEGKELPWRFYVRDNPHVSKK
ncbi:DNA-3-methyladenine glycosylase [Candidatus Woesearchaeota archaeon]|nr:DNA-3-methyladenine glycosylase [Candidatus Woesearchaeota archaeon]